MTNNYPLNDREFETLYRKIFDCIVRSPEVKAELMGLLKKGKLNNETVFLLMARTEELLQAIIKLELEEVSRLEARVVNTIRKQHPVPVPKEAQYIDGRKLSPLEIDFEEYCRLNFDSGEWLKELGIIYP